MRKKQENIVNLQPSNLTITMTEKRYRAVVLALTFAATLTAQPESRDTTAIRVGYTGVSSSTLAGAVDKVTTERMNKGLVTSSLGALSGQSAGVSVVTGVNQEAMVSAVRVRGTTSLTGGNDPLVIIDGVTSDLTTLSTIYPADIESFTILKDASETSQYGSRGAAGVIEVATKKGHGQQFHISYDGTVGFERIYKRIDMLSGPQFRQAAADLGISITDRGADTDFSRSIERTGFVQHHHIAFGGGSESANYRASIGVMDHRTVIRNNNFANYTAKLNVTQRAFDDHLTVDLGVFGSLQKNDMLPFLQKLVFSSDTFNPTFPDGTNSQGGFDQVPEAAWISNPNALMKMQQDEDNGHLNVHMNATALLARGLKLRAFASYSYNSVGGAHYYPTIVWSHGEAYRRHDKHEELLGNLSVDYTFRTGPSAFNLMALAETGSTKDKGFFTTVTGFSTDAFGYDKLSAGAVTLWDGTDSYYTDSHMESFLLHGQYTLLDRYTLTLNGRADASSKVGRNHRWGFFPSVSAAWVISKEKWMKAFGFVSNAKLRLGYGLSGNLGGIDSYNSLMLVQPNGVVPVDGMPVVTLGPIRNANPDLKWEVKRTFNVGFDLTFWDGRIALAVDHYRSRTTDMLYVYDVPVPPFTYNKLLANLGTMRNWGLEVGFGVTPLLTKDVSLTVNMNWTFERNKLVSLNGYYNGQYLTTPQMKGIANLWGPGFHGGSDVVTQIVGEPLGMFYLPHCKGLITDKDGFKHYDVTDERYICGQATPKAMVGSNVALRFRQLDLTLQLNGAFGHKIYNGTALTYNNLLSLPNYNVMEGAPEKRIADQTISDYWLERGDYVNIDYVTLGWNVPLRSRHVQSMRVSASVNNLATITGYSGLTPMINSSVVNATLGIDDKLSIPVYRSYTVGLSIQF